MKKPFSTEENEENKEHPLPFAPILMRRAAKRASKKLRSLCFLRYLLCNGLLFFVFSTSASLPALEVTQPAAPDQPAAPVEDPAKPLGELVGKLAGLDTLSAQNLADFATQTIAYSQALQGAKQQVSEKPIHDALDAVAQGRALDAKAADWDDLQARLEKFLEKSEEQQKQDQQQPQQDKQDKDEKDNKQDQKNQQQQNQQGQSGDKNDQQQNKDQQGQQGQDNQQQQQQDGQQGQQQQGDKNQQSGDQQNQPNQQDQQQNNGETQPQDNVQQKESAFGDMNKKESDEQKDASQQSQEQQQQQAQAQQMQQGEMQQIGGADEKQKAPIDSRMLVPMQKLDQVRDKDSPAILFQRMQAAQGDKQQQPAGAQQPKGKDW